MTWFHMWTDMMLRLRRTRIVEIGGWSPHD